MKLSLFIFLLNMLFISSSMLSCTKQTDFLSMLQTPSTASSIVNNNNPELEDQIDSARSAMSYNFNTTPVNHRIYIDSVRSAMSYNFNTTPVNHRIYIDPARSAMSYNFNTTPVNHRIYIDPARSTINHSFNNNVNSFDSNIECIAQVENFQNLNFSYEENALIIDLNNQEESKEGKDKSILSNIIPNVGLTYALSFFRLISPCRLIPRFIKIIWNYRFYTFIFIGTGISVTLIWACLLYTSPSPRDA